MRLTQEELRERVLQEFDDYFRESVHQDGDEKYDYVEENRGRECLIEKTLQDFGIWLEHMFDWS